MQTNDVSHDKLKKKIRRGYFIIAFIAVFPFISVLLASFLGWCLDCTVNEAGTSGCIRWGINFGETLSTLFIMGWTFFYTFPLAFVLFIVWSMYSKRKTANMH